MKISQAVKDDVTQRYVNNLLRLAQVAIGQALDGFWYMEKHGLLLEIANEYNVSVETVAYVVATLSPSLSWNANVESTLAFFDGWFARPTNKRQNAYGTNVRKCVDYMLGKRVGQPTGRKVSAFYRNLLGDKQAVTLDRHAIRAARWGVRNMHAESGKQKICAEEFSVVQNAYKIAANCWGVSPSYLQALVWQLFCQ